MISDHGNRRYHRESASEPGGRTFQIGTLMDLSNDFTFLFDRLRLTEGRLSYHRFSSISLKELRGLFRGGLLKPKPARCLLLAFGVVVYRT